MHRCTRCTGAGNAPDRSTTCRGPEHHVHTKEIPEGVPEGVLGERQVRERQALALAVELAELRGTDPAQEHIHASSFERNGRIVLGRPNPAALSDTRLALTIADLEGSIADEKAAREGLRMARA